MRGVCLGLATRGPRSMPIQTSVTRYPQRVVRVVAVAAVLVFGVAGCVAVPDETAEETIELVAPSLPEPEVIEPEPPRFDLGLYPIDEADSLWVVVNKLRPLDPID